MFGVCERSHYGTWALVVLCKSEQHFTLVHRDLAAIGLRSINYYVTLRIHASILLP